MWPGYRTSSISMLAPASVKKNAPISPAAACRGNGGRSADTTSEVPRQQSPETGTSELNLVHASSGFAIDPRWVRADRLPQRKETAMTDIAQDQDIVQVLQSQHQQVREILTTLGKASATERAGQFRELITMLKAHEAAEESVVYPAIRGVGGESVANKRIAEEKEAETVISKLQQADPASSEFAEMFNKFHAAVEKHASAEESEVFPLLSKKFDQDTRRSMGSELKRAEQQNGWTPNGRH